MPDAAATPPANKNALPRPLMIVATTLIIGGALFAVRALLTFNVIALLVAAAEIAMGVGLIKLEPRFRIATLVWLGLLMGVCGINLMLLVLTRLQHHLAPIGGAHSPGAVKLLVNIVIFTLAALGYRILKRPTIQALFFRGA